ncbi:hypothetical protein [Streptosporangium sp. KLBMP 9127]|nr:hypothetical protein [Streptosporangium sp. KLBMP 9127]
MEDTWPIEIGHGLHTPSCVDTTIGRYAFANRLSDYPIHVCLGSGRRCEDGHGVTAITIPHGEEAAIVVPLREGWLWAQAPRNYPITVYADPAADLPVIDLVIRSVPPSD